MVNGQAIEPNIRILIHPGDSIGIGKFALEVEEISESLVEKRQATSKDRVPEQDDLLASLEEFIRDRTVHDGRSSSEKKSVTEQSHFETTVTWTSTTGATGSAEASTDLRNEETRLLDESSQSGETPASDETVSLKTDGDKLVDEAELRRLDLRRRLEGMKAQNSKEAADRALKKLFGG